MRRKERFSLKDIHEHYWACSNCMKRAGGVWIEGHVATAKTNATCGVCGTEGVTTIPWVDYTWPKETSLTNFKASMGRD